MSKFSEYIGSQFGNPRGIIGKVCCLVMNTINNRMYRSVVAALKIHENSNILDIGYGNGYLVKKIYGKYRPNIYGIDISEDMKKSAEKRNQKAVSERKLHLTTGDCCSLSYDDGFFQAVTSINTVYFWGDTLKGLKEIHRTLSDDGVFYNAVYTKEWLQRTSYTKKGFKLFEPEEFIALGKEAGFSHVYIQDIIKGKSYVVIHKK